MRAVESKRHFIELSIRFGALKFGGFTIGQGTKAQQRGAE